MLIEAAIPLITVVRDIRHCQSGGIFNLRDSKRYNLMILLLEQ